MSRSYIQVSRLHFVFSSFGQVFVYSCRHCRIAKLELLEWYLLFTGAALPVVGCVTEFQIMPQTLSTQPTVGDPFWAVGFKLLVAQGMLNQSVEQVESVTVPWLGVPLEFCPVILNAMEFGVVTKMWSVKIIEVSQDMFLTFKNFVKI